ncbi:uncharacterized protein LOC113279368 [Papaver somniferum]|uniref:uncharacterized protein LOC113279368 n=1 Tax=Papaver somniferum TaxID=3469 RepID=UPI000E6F6ED5|nr:uncharacterized protein LOC113279368 [Papaver somniferum]
MGKNMIGAETELCTMAQFMFRGKLFFYNSKFGCVSMHLHAWSKSCKGHGDIISSPLNGRELDFLIHDISKPIDEVSFSCAGDINDVVSRPCLDLDLLDKVFQTQFHIIFHIPIKCRLSFSRAFKQTIDTVIINPLDTSCWIKLLLFPICILRNYVPKSKVEERSEHDISTKSKFSGHKDNQVDANLRLCRRKLGQGSYTTVIRVLTSSGVAPLSDNTLVDLKLKHPYAPPPTLPTAPNEVVAATASSDMVLSRIQSFPKGTSCGRDGLHAQHFLDVLSGSDVIVVDDLLDSITSIVNILLSGNCPPQLGMCFASAPLTPLLKPGGGIRPIEVGTIWRGLVYKVVTSVVSKDMSIYLGYFQFGVGVPCGGEAILHSANRILDEKRNLNTMSMLLVDFRNAFNLVDRSAMLREVRNKCPSVSRWVGFCYASPARLYYGSSTLSSSQGVQQGDLLGPLLFSLTLHPTALKISRQCKLDLQAWYLDDGTIIGDTLMVSQDFHIIKTEGDAIGLDLNIQKTELFWPSFDVRSTQVGVFPADIVRPSVGVKLLGGPVSLDASFCSQLVFDRVHKSMQLMDAVHRLDDPQSELMLFHNCAGISKLYFTLRTTAPCYVKDAQVVFDKYFSNFMRKLVIGDGPVYGLLQHRVASLPIRDGGLGIYSMYDTMQYCYLASCSQTL